MIRRIEDMNYYELLEVSPNATSQEIHKAYERIRRVYEPNSVALYSLFSPEETAAINQRIEDAYRTLVYEDNRRRYDAMLLRRGELPDLEPVPVPAPAPLVRQPSLFEPPPPAMPPVEIPKPPVVEAAVPEPARPAPRPEPVKAAVAQFIGEFTGPAIKMLREQSGLTLRNIADLTKLSARYLEFIEDENFGKLPARAYIRGFLSLYAKALGCDPERVIGDYLKRYDAAMTPKPK